MNDIEFKIFTRNKGRQISVNIVVYTLLISSLGILFFEVKYFDNSAVEKVGLWGLSIAGLIMVYFKIAQSFTRKSLNGNLNRSLNFREKEILIDSEKYDLNDIQKIEFSICDYFDKWEYPGRGNFNPARTNGTDNSCEITLISGQKIKVNFQLTQKDEFKKMRELLIKYYSDNKIHFLRLIEYLGIDKYEEIQDFKKTLPPTKCLRNGEVTSRY